eukprot:g37582.t1
MEELEDKPGEWSKHHDKHTTQENSRATILEVYRSKLRAGFLPPTNSFLLSPNECLTVEWVKPLIEQKVAKPATYLPTPSFSPPTSSSSSSLATHPPARSVTSTLPSSVPNSARKMTAEEEEEKDVTVAFEWREPG